MQKYIDTSWELRRVTLLHLNEKKFELEKSTHTPKLILDNFLQEILIMLVQPIVLNAL